ALYVRHLSGNRVRAVASKPIHASAQQKMGSDVLGGAEELVDVAFSIADVHTSGWLGQQFGRLAKVLEPADAFLLLDRYARRVNFLLQRIRSFEFLAGPELDRRQSQRQPFGRHRKTRMQQNP